MKICKVEKLDNNLSKEKISNQLLNNHKIEIFDEIDSTNNYLKTCSKSQKEDFHIAIANCQTNGRGRMNRSFFSPLGKGIYFSILLYPSLTPQDCIFLTIIAAVSVTRAIKQTLNLDTQIKWVNDIYCKGKKLCGILTETTINTKDNKLDFAVVGIGINFEKTTFPPEISNIATSLEECAKFICDKNTLIAEIINNFEELYNKLPNKDFMKEYCAKSILIGKEVTVIQHNCSYKAYVSSIDENANLIVKDQNGKLHTLFSGEVSLKI